MRLAIPTGTDHTQLATAIFRIRQAATFATLVAFLLLGVVFEQEWINQFAAVLLAFWLIGFVPWALAARGLVTASTAIHAIIAVDIVFIAVTIARTPQPTQLSTAFFAVMTAASVAFAARTAYAYLLQTIVCGLGAVALLGDPDDLPGMAVTMVMLAAVSIVLIGLRENERATSRDLQRNERQLQRAETVAQIGSWQWHPPSGELLWSRNMFLMLGRDPDGGQPDFDAWAEDVPRDRLETLRRHARRTLETGEDYEFDSVLELPTGERRIIQARGSRITDADGEVWLVGTAQDVTDLRRVDDLKDEFVATASHELRTPATIVLGAARTLDDRWDDLDEDVRRELVRHLRDGGERMSRLIEDVLSVSRIEHGELQVSPAPVGIAALVEDVASSLRNPRISTRVDDSVAGEDVLADVDRVGQVLFNLLENALRYDPTEGDVRVEVDRAADSDHVVVRVVDQGPGVEADQRERIFHRFVRGTEGSRRGEPGTGLGLYVARSLVEQHGGTLWVEDAPSDDGANASGSAFCFTLPLVNRSARG